MPPQDMHTFAVGTGPKIRWFVLENSPTLSRSHRYGLRKSLELVVQFESMLITHRVVERRFGRIMCRIRKSFGDSGRLDLSHQIETCRWQKHNHSAGQIEPEMCIFCT